MKKIIYVVLLAFSFQIFPIRSMEYKLSLGAGVLAKTNLRKNNLYKDFNHNPVLKFIPMLQFGFGPLRISGNGITFSFVGNREQAIYLNLSRQGDKYLGSNMEKRSDSWFLGLGLKLNHYSLVFSHDLEHKSRGKRIYFNHLKIWDFDLNHQLVQTIGLEHFNDSYAQYYYGISGSEITVDRPAYYPSDFFQLTTSLIYNYTGIENWQITNGLVIKKIPNMVSNSPTMKKTDFDFSLIFGLSRIFK